MKMQRFFHSLAVVAVTAVVTALAFFVGSIWYRRRKARKLLARRDEERGQRNDAYPFGLEEADRRKERERFNAPVRQDDPEDMGGVRK